MANEWFCKCSVNYNWVPLVYMHIDIGTELLYAHSK